MNDLLSTASLRRLQVFLVVSETLHMGRAAEQLDIAQPALSQQIRGLETALGVRLFNRRKRGIDLTAAGEACRTEALRLLALHGGIIETVRRTARGEMGRIAMGYVGSSMFEPEFPAQLRQMREMHPGVELQLREASVATLLALLGAGELDLALIRAPAPIPSQLTYRVHSKHKLAVILSAAHPLARLKRVPISRLASEPMIGYPDADNVGIMGVVQNLARAAGVTVETKWRVSEIGSVLGLVAAGLGYGVVSENIATLAGPEIATRPLADPNARADLWLVWNEQRMTPALSQFLQITAAR
jgi:DNA-binding transcriptional LysR family regulator